MLHRVRIRNKLPFPTFLETFTVLFLGFAIFFVELHFGFCPNEPIDYADRPGGILHMDHRFVIARGDFDGRVLGACGRSPDQKRKRKLLAFHLLGHMHHLIQRRSNQTR